MVSDNVAIDCIHTYGTFSKSNELDNGDCKVEVVHNGHVATSTPSRIIPLSPSQYSELFFPHDIPYTYHSKLCKSLKSFDGKWRIMLKRSDSIDTIMKALGVGIIKRQLMNKHRNVFECRVSSDCSSVHIQSRLPLGVVKEGTLFFDKDQIQEHHDETGRWRCQSFFHDGRVLQKRNKPGGVMYDTRGIFEKDPIDNNNSSMVMLFVWRYVTDEGEVLSANRWLEKLE